MKCPLRSQSYKGEYNQDQYEDLDCLKEECAVWDEQLECCTWVSIRVALKALFDVLTAISRKMPHEEQFRK